MRTSSADRSRPATVRTSARLTGTRWAVVALLTSIVVTFAVLRTAWT